MREGPNPYDVANALRVSVGLLVRRLRQRHAGGELTLPEIAALARLERGGPATASALAKLEQITPQSMGTTLDALERRGLIKRGPDPHDGRRVVVCASKAGLHLLRSARNARTEGLAQALGAEFTRTELKALMAAAPLLERLAEKLS
ncbi:MAG TPA: MarR family transcriptional regulator [Verrucomicrobiae bacterium]|nr:MarR family transcriptional regulator [Verrucomicrobiae bacterium]